MKNYAEFCKRTDVDAIIATALKCLEERMSYPHNEKFTCSSTVCDYLRLQLAQEKNEVFAALFLDNQHRLLSFDRLFSGTVNQTVVYPRQVVQKAIHYNAAAIIVAHNHPSGNSKPSEADKEVTRDLKKILDIINVDLLDHIVVTFQDTYSFSEYRLL